MIRVSGVSSSLLRYQYIPNVLLIARACRVLAPRAADAHSHPFVASTRWETVAPAPRGGFLDQQTKPESMACQDTSLSPWWQGATIYQILIRAVFSIPQATGWGIWRASRKQLDYVADLGVDAIWISPFVQSPMQDFGYDVAGTTARVDPLFGGLGGFPDPASSARTRRGLRVMMDQGAVAHLPNQHPVVFWKAGEGRDKPQGRLVRLGRSGRGRGTAEQLAFSVFGGIVVAVGAAPRASTYLHNFLRSATRPKLPLPRRCRREVLNVCKFWLELGVDGFRLDVCAFYFHDARLRDNPHNPEVPKSKVFQFNPLFHADPPPRHRAARDHGMLARLRALCDD